MSLKAKVEAIIYATEEPVTLNELALLLKDAVLADLRAEEQARLALNETISDGSTAPQDADDSGDTLPDDSLIGDESLAPDESAASAEPWPQRRLKLLPKQLPPSRHRLSPKIRSRPRRRKS